VGRGWGGRRACRDKTSGVRVMEGGAIAGGERGGDFCSRVQTDLD